MKPCVVFAAAAFVATISLEPTMAMRSYLKKFPNGDAAFTQSLGHVSDSSTDLNDFGKLYSKNSGDWSKLCKETFPGTSFTVGAAFGDPCCTWKDGGKPDFTVTPFVKPTKGETCAANAPASAAPSPAAPPAAATPTVTPAPAAATPSPKPLLPGAPNPGTPGKLPGVPNPGVPGKLPGVPNPKCGVKKEAKSLEEDNDEESDIDY